MRILAAVCGMRKDQACVPYQLASKPMYTLRVCPG